MSDREAAAERLEEAIQEHARAWELVDPGGFVVRWMLIGVVQDPEHPDRTGYFQSFQGGHMPPHEIIGLLSYFGSGQVFPSADDDD